jgi:D-inositol-3-phosphate glycosyltransferase
MAIQRLMLLSVHTSPLAHPGSGKVGGMNVYVNEIAKEFGKRGIQVDIFTRRSSPVQPESDNSLHENVRVIHVTCGPETQLSPDELFPHLQQFTAGVIAFATLHNLQYDLIYSHYWLSGWVARSLKEIWGIPFVQMFHTLGHMKNRIEKNAFTTEQRVIGETKLVQVADVVIAATPAEQSQLMWLYRADRRKIHVVPPGVNPERFYPIPQQVAKYQLGVPQEQKIILFVGRLERLKAIDSIFEALNLIQINDPISLTDVQFWVLGGQPLDKELVRLKQVSSTLGLDGIVQFKGSRTQDELRLHYAASDVVVMPSDYESFGMVALEAMACGTPVIASQVGGLAFLIDDERSGYLVPVREPSILANRISRILNHPAEHVSMRFAAAAAARQYTWPAIADRLLNQFDTLTSRHMRSEYQLQ